MQISRLVIRNFRLFRELDIKVNDDLCCIIGENNTGKTALFRAIQICLDVALPSVFRSLKGREFDAVAIIHANEGQIPHFTARTQPEFDEARRLFYVGITRARKHLLVVSDQLHHLNRPTRFIVEAGLSN